METGTQNISSDIWFDVDTGRNVNQKIRKEVPNRDSTETDDAHSTRNLNFSTSKLDSEERTWNHKKNILKKIDILRNPMTHRMIEKRRRDRMNNCLADLSRLIPKSYQKQGQGRLEKTEIIKMAINHIQYLQGFENDKSTENDVTTSASISSATSNDCCIKKFYLGFQECQHEVIRFLVESEGKQYGDPFCLRIVNHLKNASHSYQDNITDGIKTCQAAGTSDNTNSLYATEIKGGNTVMYDSSSDSGWCEASRSINENYVSNDPWSAASMTKSWSLGSGSSSEAIFNSTNGSVSSGGSVSSYKFKHNITKRFSREAKTARSDTSSSSSKESGKSEGRACRMARQKSLGQNQLFTPFSALCCSSKYSFVGTESNSDGYSSANGNYFSNHETLPAFILHPQGTHYLPFSVHSSQIESSTPDSSLSSNSNNPLTFHPISIPVNFSDQSLHIRMKKP